MKTRLRVLRAEREWSQADLAERLHVSRQTINAIETGKYDPSLSRMLKNGLGRNSAFFLFLLSEAEVQFVEGPT